MGSRSRLLIVSAVLVVLAAAAAGCSNDEGDTAPAPQDPEALVGVRFVGTEGTQSGEPLTLEPGTQIRVEFEGAETLLWDAGCNQTFSTVMIGAAELTVEDRFGSTLMGCPGALGRQESWLTELLTSDPAWRLEGDTLELTSGDDAVVLERSEERFRIERTRPVRPATEVPAAARPLVSREPRAMSVRCGPGLAGQSLAAYPTIDFVELPTNACIIVRADGTIIDLLEVDDEWTKLRRGT